MRPRALAMPKSMTCAAPSTPTRMLCGETSRWTIRKGSLAPQAAGVIHTDFEKGFIRAQVYSVEDLEKNGNEAAIKAAGKLRMEGKDYVVQDGDVMHFLFNV